MTRNQLNIAITALVKESKHHNELAIPGDVLFPIHMTVACTLASLAAVAMELYLSTPHTTQTKETDHADTTTLQLHKLHGELP